MTLLAHLAFNEIEAPFISVLARKCLLEEPPAAGKGMLARLANGDGQIDTVKFEARKTRES
jgi:hypothetical protein